MKIFGYKSISHLISLSAHTQPLVKRTKITAVEGKLSSAEQLMERMSY